MRSDLSISFTCGSISALVHQPSNHLSRAVTRIGDQTRRSDLELFNRAVEHRLGSADFGLTNGRRRLDVHDHCMLQIDEVVVGIGITGDRVGRSGVAGRRIGWEITFGSTGSPCLKAASSRTDRYSATARRESERDLRPWRRLAVDVRPPR